MFKRSDILGMRLIVVHVYKIHVHACVCVYLNVLWLEENNGRTMDKEDDKKWTTLLSPATYIVTVSINDNSLSPEIHVSAVINFNLAVGLQTRHTKYW